MSELMKKKKNLENCIICFPLHFSNCQKAKTKFVFSFTLSLLMYFNYFGLNNSRFKGAKWRCQRDRTFSVLSIVCEAKTHWLFFPECTLQVQLQYKWRYQLLWICKSILLFLTHGVIISMGSAFDKEILRYSTTELDSIRVWSEMSGKGQLCITHAVCPLDQCYVDCTFLDSWQIFLIHQGFGRPCVHSLSAYTVKKTRFILCKGIKSHKPREFLEYQWKDLLIYRLFKCHDSKLPQCKSRIKLMKPSDHIFFS